MTSDPHKGGIYYSDYWSAKAVFYGDGHIAAYVLVHIGDINEDISSLAAEGHTVEAIFEVVE